MLKSLHIKNFRCFEDLTIPSLGQVNLIVGKNNSGKSTLLEAIAIYASKGRNIEEILSKRDELLLPSEDDEFSLLVKVLFYGRNTPETNQEIYIGSKNKNQFLTIKSSFFFEQTEEVKYAGGTTINKKVLIPILDKDIIDDENIKFGISISDGTIDDQIISIERLRSPTSVRRRKELIKTETPTSYVPTDIEPSSEIAILWDEAIAKAYKREIINKLTIIDKNIEDLDFIETKGRRGRIGIAKSKNLTTPIPLKSMGEGMSRLLQLFLYAYQAKGGYLLIDEFENGLHYSIQEEVWEKLFKLAKELDIQVFSTTHSEDTVKAFCKVANDNKEVDGKLISLARSAKTSNEGQIFPITYEEDKLQTFIEMGMEVR